MGPENSERAQEIRGRPERRCLTCWYRRVAGRRLCCCSQPRTSTHRCPVRPRC